MNKAIFIKYFQHIQKGLFSDKQLTLRQTMDWQVN